MLTVHDVKIRVRYQETDAMGLLHHANYFTYFEIGRTELLRAAGGNYREMEQQGQFIVVVKAECRYRMPARYDDLLTIRTAVTRVSAAKIEHQYDVSRDGQQIAIGSVTLAIVDSQGKVQRIPDWMRPV
jgi:acyl-CoA thioester hydrolase